MVTTRERGILFSPPMARMVRQLEGPKTETRRLIVPQPQLRENGTWRWEGRTTALDNYDEESLARELARYCPYGQPGDRLWVREDYISVGHWEVVPDKRTRTGREKWRFVEDGNAADFFGAESYPVARPAESPGLPTYYRRLGRFMPRKHARTFLVLDGVGAHRLLSITEEEARREGMTLCNTDGDWLNGDWRNGFDALTYPNARAAFLGAISRLHGPDMVAENRWAWALKFHRIEQ